MLAQWDEKYGLTVRDARADSLTLTFSSLPDSLDDLLREILEMCPDASEGERELLEELEKTKNLSLGWD